MEERGIRDQIPEKDFQKEGYRAGYKVLHQVLKSGVVDKKFKDLGTMAISGAAPGADTYLSYLFDKAGVPTVHYLVPEKVFDFNRRFKQGQGSRKYSDKPPGYKLFKSIPREMDTKEMSRNIGNVEAAATELNKTLPTKSMNLQLRNAEIVKKSSKIYAVAEILTDKSSSRNPNELKWIKENPQLKHRATKGGTGWTVQMALDAKKPVYVFDPVRDSWYMFNYKAKRGGRFETLVGTPLLSDRPVVVGTRFINKKAKEAMKELVAKKFPDAFPDVNPRKKATVAGAREEVNIKLHDKALKQFAEVTDKLIEVNDRIEDIQDVIKDPKTDKLRIKDLKKELPGLKKTKKQLDTTLELSLIHI